MIYIFDGSDLTGKTTLANKFAKENDIPIIKKRLDIPKLNVKGKLNDNVIECYSQFFFESIYPIGTKYSFVLDRSLLSSIVYSKFFQRNYNINYVYNYLVSERNKYITMNLVIADEEFIQKAFDKRGEQLFTVKDLLLIQDLFINTAEVLKSKGAIINIIENHWEELCLES